MERRCSLIVGTTYWTPLSEKRPGKVLGAAVHSSRPSISIGDDYFPLFEIAHPVLRLRGETRNRIRAAAKLSCKPSTVAALEAGVGLERKNHEIHRPPFASMGRPPRRISCRLPVIRLE